MGGEFTDYICDLLFGVNPSNGRSWPKWLKDDFRQTPFEAATQNFPDRDSIRRALQRAFATSVINPVHELLSTQLRDGVVSSIITTNYDLCLDAALSDVQGLRSIWDNNTWDAANGSLSKASKLYWKIHGTARPDALDSLIFKLEDEGRMPKWKSELLNNTLADRTLVIFGYSGRDFEICPQLAYYARPRHTVWFQPSREALTANGKRVLTERQGTLVVGSRATPERPFAALEDFLEKLFGTRLKLQRKACPVDLVLDHSTFPEWRVRILDWMACGRLAVPEINKLANARTRAELLASAYGHLGKYRDSVLELERLAAERSLDRREQLHRQLSAASSWFILGAHIKGWKQTRLIEKSCASEGLTDLRVEIAERKLMMQMRLAQIVGTTRLPFLVNTIRARAVRMYEDARRELELGAWGRLQALRLNAQRIGIATENEMTLPSVEGYSSLGAVGMLSIAVRDEVRKKGGWFLSPIKRSACLWGIKKARMYGWTHEEWKFRWLLLIRGGGRFRSRHLVAWWRSFRVTQYTTGGRLIQILNATVPQQQ